MKRLLKAVGVLFGLVLLLGAGFASYVQVDGIPHFATPKIELKADPTPARVDRGRKLVNMLCAECHLDQKSGRLSGRRMADLPTEFGACWSRNITRHPSRGIGGWSDGELAYLIRTGIARDGRYTPPWMVKLPHLSDEDLASVISFLRSDDPMVAPDERTNTPCEPSFLTKLLAHTAFRPLPYPAAPIATPTTAAPLELGRYLAVNLACYDCHSQDFKSNDPLHPEQSAGFMGGGNALADSTGRPVFSANITFDEETGIGRWSKEDFRRAVRDGFRPDRSPVEYPMPRYAELSDLETDALYDYLKTVPKLRKSRPARPVVPDAVVNASPGSKVFHTYACQACHSEDGNGICDLREASAKYPTDAALIDFIKNPSKAVPGSRMPAWENVIPDADYPALIAHIRALSAQASR